MERFRPALRRVAAELDLPRGARTELLLELAADLQAVYEHYRARGLREDEAAVRAEATVLGSTEVIRRLGRLHLSPWRGWAEEMSGTLRGVHAVVLVSVGVLPVVATAVGVSVWVLAHRASPFAWSILVVCALVTAVAAKDALRILRDRPGHRGYAQRLLLLAAMAPALGLLAPIFGLQRAVAAFDDRAPEEALLLESLAPELATFLAGLFVGIAGLLVWFVLIELEARRSAREMDALFAHDVPPAVVPGATDAGGSVIPLVRRRQG